MVYGVCGVIHHGVFKRVPRNRRAAQALQNTELNFVRSQAMQLVKAGSKTLKRFTRQAKNQIRMHMGLTLRDQPAQVISGLDVVLPA